MGTAAPPDATAALRERVEALPAEPGVYLLKDRSGRVIYVGKATDLRRRVRSYVAARDDRAFMPFLAQQAADVETIVVRTEKEAFLLENELIKRHQPRFNVKLKEGGRFVHLRLDPRERYPSLQVVRVVESDGARYFGPYPAARALRETLRVVNRHFQLRTCTDHDPRSHARPCLLCQIARFPEPSIYDVPPETYRRHVEDAVRFLEGRRPELARSLRRQMDRAARRFDFETAARLRDRLAAIERTLQPQLVTGTTSTRDQDVFGLAQRDGRLAIYVLHVRRGRVIGGRTARFAQPSLPAEDLMASFVNLYYSQGNLVPDEVLLPVAVEGAAALAELLSERRGSPVRVVAPRRGPRRELVALSTRNAEQALARAAPEAGGSPKPDVLRSLRHRLGLRRVPHLIECFDVSHFHGEATVASKVAMVDAEPDKNLYRRYRIGTAARGDDYAAMREAVLRRLRRGPAEEGLPDLIVLDGGRAQLSAARDAADELGVRDVDFVALAKRREIGPPGPAAERRRVPERVFVPGRKDAIVLPPTASELLLLVRLRDEAHRFAHAYRQKLERRRRLRSELDRIPGIGERRRGALLRRFGSVERIRGASAEELAATEGIGAALAARIHASLQPGPGSASRAG